MRRKKRWLVEWARAHGVEVPKGFRWRSLRCGKPCRELLRRVQRKADLKVTAEFDARTLWLIAPMKERAVMVARGELGEKEEPAGSNWGDRIKLYLAAAGFNFPTAWCAAFCVYCLKRAGYRGSFPPKPGWVPSWSEWAKGKGILVSRPKRGDLIIMWGRQHIGIVTRVVFIGGTVQYRTIEGNTGDMVARRVRTPLDKAEFVRWW